MTAASAAQKLAIYQTNNNRNMRNLTTTMTAANFFENCNKNVIKSAEE